MGTVKRERQKANRQLRLEELAKQARKDKTKRFSLRIGLALVSVVALVGVLYLLNGGDDDSTVAGTTTIDPSLTVPVGPCPNAPTPPDVPPSTTAPTKPEIAGPAPAEITALKVTPITEGSGPAAAECDLIDVNYLGYTSADGVEFDNSYDRGASYPIVIGASSVIEGWTLGLVGMQAGGRYQLDIPAELAYGADPSATGGRPAGALTFIIDVMSVTPATADVTDTTADTTAETTPATTTSLPAPATT